MLSHSIMGLAVYNLILLYLLTRGERNHNTPLISYPVGYAVYHFNPQGNQNVTSKTLGSTLFIILICNGISLKSISYKLILKKFQILLENRQPLQYLCVSIVREIVFLDYVLTTNSFSSLRNQT